MDFYTEISLFLIIIITLINNIESLEYFKKLGPHCNIGWELEQKKESITFNLICETRGFIGFGISNKGGMKNSDIIVGGVYDNGTAYLEDRHGVGNIKPEMDKQQDYKLISAVENETHTFLRFSRLISTCDPQDVAITNDSQKLIWALSPSNNDNLEIHGPTRRGVMAVNLLDGRVPPLPIKGEVLRLEQNIVLNGNSTMYWCKIHKPLLPSKRHITGFGIYLNSSISYDHTHHGSILKCTPPPGQSLDFFEHYANKEFDCYYSTEYFPTDYCKLFKFQWSLGGEYTTFPPSSGVPIGETENEYYMTMFHINNPEMKKDIEFISGMDLHLTKEIRKNDIGFWQLGINSSRSFALTVPPNSVDYLLSSHCPGQCTSTIPSEGVDVFVYLLHFHLSGRKMKIRHFRNGTELPWIAKDDNYDTDYQMSRILRETVKVMPQDHLTVECVFETEWLHGKTVIGGRSIDDEMCQAFLMYYPKVPTINRCGSSFPQKELLDFMGIDSVKMENSENDPIVMAPMSMYRMKYTEVVSSKVNWTKEMREKYQEITRYGKHIVDCTGLLGIYPESKYPNIIEEYIPQDKCKSCGSNFGMDKIVLLIFIGIAIN